MVKNTQSISEKKLIAELVNVGLYPKPQYKISEMHVDIAFPEKNLVIEIDGPFHEKTKEKDASRDHELEIRGWKVLRYSSNEAHDSPIELANKIKEEYELINDAKSANKQIRKEKTHVEKVAYSPKVSYPWKVILILLIMGIIIVLILNKFS